MSDNELDAELLGMVGGESDDEGEGEVNQTQAYDERSPSQEAKQSVEKVEDANKRTKGIAQKVKGRRKRARKQESEEEDDLGSPSPAASLASQAMDESDGEMDAPSSQVDDDAPLFPLEGKYLSAQDKSDILAMTEVEREEVLADRAQQLVKRQQDLQLKKALAATKAAASKHRKRSAATAELEDGGRRTRPKAEKTKTALDDYKRARELKGTERGRLEAERSSRRDERRSPSGASERDAEGEEEEVEFAEPYDSRRRDEPLAEKKDFDRCRIGRTAFAKVCFYPGFEDAVKGCYARVSIGLDRHTGQNTYRMTQIKGFTEGKPYQMEAPNGKHFNTDVYAVVAHGAAEKPWPFSACSDSHFTDQEYDRYIDTLKKDNIRTPLKKHLSARLDAIHGLLNMDWTDERITQKLANQRAMEKKLDPANAAVIKLEKIKQRRLKAEQDGDSEEVARCDAEVAALENATQSMTNGHGNANGTVKPSPKKNNAPMSQQDRLAQINMKNRSKTTEEVRKALIEERRKLQAAREKAAAEAKEAKAKKEAEEKAKLLLAVPKGEMDDLFGSDVSRAASPAPSRRSRTGTPVNGGVKREKSGGGLLGAIRKKALDDEVIGSMDLGIDIEI
ncbi:hypothetical protein BAUCODRAFT_293733 [Baudoinia panamericana UAMH 10762]|uniref:Plus3 domain-containing protein n=1 Tax=Baudoinia panamericana (strain UAMH 10762) TaxID=717646 RepID=M2N1J1_BAUPA|nr:uncharacterized protein BAUCODRAFT_293733 [Baudoinia panamericana UAMH 10762]EMC92495.1 hypothetical protein BAUCODRAFT_293733 [Baudoinia panamericana UAMH 10762]